MRQHAACLAADAAHCSGMNHSMQVDVTCMHMSIGLFTLSGVALKLLQPLKDTGEGAAAWQVYGGKG